jgi:D-amino-acid dehydrogenase
MAPDVVVVGGGAVGACCALELARRGARVTLVEKGPALASGCSAGNAGLVCPSHSTPLSNPAALRNGLRWLLRSDSPFALKPRPRAVPWLARFTLASRRADAGAQVIRTLSSASLELHRELADTVGTGLVQKGVLDVHATAQSLAAGRAAAERSGLRFEVLDREAALTLEPALGPRTAGAVLHPDEAHCDPQRFVAAVGVAASAAGAEIALGVEVRRLRADAGRVVVETADGELRPETVVLAAGAWSAGLARHAGVFVPLEGGKGYHVDLEAGEDDPARPVWLQEAWAIATPLPGRLRLAGTLELAGLDLGIDRRRAEAVRLGGLRGLRGLEGRRVLEVWAGLRPCTPDGLPVIGRAPLLPGLVLATGHGMKGVALAPVTGRLVGELVAGERASLDLEPLRPERFRTLLSARARSPRSRSRAPAARAT